MSKSQTKKSVEIAFSKKCSHEDLVGKKGAKTPISFEDALEELEEIAEKLEKGDISLNEIVQLYKRGRALHDFCSQQLEEAHLKVHNITRNEEGAIERSESVLQNLYDTKEHID